MQPGVEQATYPRGESHWNAKLSESDARAILASRELAPALAAWFGMSASTIRAIRRGERWAWLREGAAESAGCGRRLWAASSPDDCPAGEHIAPVWDGAALGFTQQLDTRVWSARHAIFVEDVQTLGQTDFGANVKRVLRNERLRLVDHKPVALETLTLPHPRFAGLREIDLTTTPLYTSLEDDFGVEVAGGTFTLDLQLLTSELAAPLGEVPGVPVYAITGAVQDETGQTIVAVNSRYRPGHFSFGLNLSDINALRRPLAVQVAGP